MLLRRRADPPNVRERSGEGAPLVANFVVAGLFLASLAIFSGPIGSAMALLLALSGLLIAVAGALLVARARADLGQAWSLAPMADAGLVTGGAYRFVRHPIYLGFALLAAGQALAFASWPSFLIVLCGMVPTFLWRARAEERLLARTFGAAYAAYRERTRMIIPFLL